MGNNQYVRIQFPSPAGRWHQTLEAQSLLGNQSLHGFSVLFFCLFFSLADLKCSSKADSQTGCAHVHILLCGLVIANTAGGFYLDSAFCLVQHRSYRFLACAGCREACGGLYEVCACLNADLCSPSNLFLGQLTGCLLYTSLITFTIFKDDGHLLTQRPQPTQEYIPSLLAG